MTDVHYYTELILAESLLGRGDAAPISLARGEHKRAEGWSRPGSRPS